jgi:hypothetical protein
LIRHLLGITLIFFAASAFAHDHTRPDLNGWMMTLHSKKGLCCSGEDGTALADPDWTAQDKEGSHYRVRVDGEWWDVPDEAVVDEPNKAEHAVVWPQRNWAIGGKLDITIRCFMPGTMT